MEAILSGEEQADYPIADGYALNIPQALDAHPPWREALSSDKPAYRRSMVRTAVLLAVLAKA